MGFIPHLGFIYLTQLASWDIITLVLDKSLYPMAGCWISYNIPLDNSLETIGKSHNSFITSVGLEMSEEDHNLPYLYWTPRLHKSPYKHRFIAGSSKCTTKDLLFFLTKLLSTKKDGLVRYCNTKTSAVVSTCGF